MGDVQHDQQIWQPLVKDGGTGRRNLAPAQTVFCWTLSAVPPSLVGSTAGGTCVWALRSPPCSQGCLRGCPRLFLWTPSSLQKPSQWSPKWQCTTFWLCLINVSWFLICQKPELIRQQWNSCSYLLKPPKKVWENLSSKTTVIHYTEHSNIPFLIH